jgi:gamma-glutamylcyclotransferase (GGCT)/AIG2-like uncharacterized protein YtfP
MEYLFSYGTLGDEKIQAYVIGRVVESKEDSLQGYDTEVISIQGESYYRAFPSEGKSLLGVCLTVTPSELVKIDQYEGTSYKRIAGCLNSGIRAWLYMRP